jgi:hypothetical protein
MNNQIRAPGPLNSWKEIADYLGVTVRTAQNWERTAGMPVRRLPGERGRVWADPAELHAWKTARPAGRRWSPRRVLGLTAAGVTLLLAALLAWWLMSGRLGPPASFRVELNRLEVLDSRGRRLWTRTLEQTLLSEAYALSLQALVRFDDIDGDGEVETLFVGKPVNPAHVGNMLHCFSAAGREKWRFKPGRVVRDRETTFSPVYLIEGFLILRVRGEPAPRIAVTSHEMTYYPNQVAVLDPAGRLEGEYWHSGHIPNVEAMDLDGDGVPEILLGGINNGYSAATLVVLDSRRVSGASVQPPEDRRQLMGFAAGTEKARLLFPRTCINRRFEQYNTVARIMASLETVTAELQERFAGRQYGTIYTFDRNLNLVGFEYSDPLRSLHRELAARGELDHELTQPEIESLKKITRLPVSPGDPTLSDNR